MKCPLCKSNKTVSFPVHSQEADGKNKKMTLLKCSGCGVVFADDYYSDRSGIYGEFYATWGKDFKKSADSVSEAKKKAFRHQMKNLTRFISPRGKKILDVGTGGGFFLEEAEKVGFECFGLDISQFACELANKKFENKIYCGTLKEAAYPDSFFDAVCLCDVLEHLSDPQEIFREIWRVIKPGGLVFVISPNHDSLTRKIFGRDWFQYKREHVFYFNRKSFQFIAQKNGFDVDLFKVNIKNFPINYYQQYFKKYEMRGFSKFFLSTFRIIPIWLLTISFPNFITGEFLAIARKKKEA
jgi:ubiquinone/menaquinone biosynthesis C-methylase UbiE